LLPNIVKAYTNEPKDPNYPNHWKTARPPTEPIEATYPGTAKNQGGLLRSKQMVTVVMTPTTIYVDTPSVQRVGLLAKLLGRGLDAGGMSTPMQFPREAVTISQPRSNRIVIQPASGPMVTARTDGFVGSPSQLSGVDQIRNLGRLFHK
jgi:hypothetical protein